MTYCAIQLHTENVGIDPLGDLHDELVFSPLDGNEFIFEAEISGQQAVELRHVLNEHEFKLLDARTGDWVSFNGASW
ncbi:hypothetical protein [Burkholderia glumae]|uniref:hypothetical protein n=1 Tax=Burkholderia glumae TaxID=337 RepID=UPI002151A4FF|nr:hypothetical protein [Burkholderia glumae]